MVDKIIKERQELIKSGAAKYLNIPSPYSVWEPAEMMFTLADGTSIKSNHELEGYYFQGTITKTDMFFLMAIHAFGYCTKECIQKLMLYWRKVEMREASEEKRISLAIPDASDKEVFSFRLGILRKYGMVCTHSFIPNVNLSGKKKDKRMIYTIGGIPTAIYRSVLENNQYRFDSREPYASEDNIMLKVQNSILTAAFLDSPFLTKAKFNYVYGEGKNKISVLSVLTMAQDGDSDVQCKLYLDSITLYTNENIVRRKDREATMYKRLKELACLIRTEREKGDRCYLILCLEDAKGIAFMRQSLYTIDQTVLPCVLFTTGTILEANNVLEYPERLCKCFFEFNKEDGYSVVGATGFYFLPWKD